MRKPSNDPGTNDTCNAPYEATRESEEDAGE